MKYIQKIKTEDLEDEELHEELLRTKIRPNKSWLNRKNISRYEMDDLFESKET
jgi:hypothetical protein